MRKTVVASLVMLVVAAGGLVFGRPASAITIIPPTLEFNANPGETITTKIKLFNETTAGLEMFPSAANFKAKDESGTPEFLTETPLQDLASWMSLEPGPFVLQPGDRIEIPVTIKIPATADPGGHFAGVLFSPQDPAKANDSTTQVTISSKIGALVLVRVSGEIRESAAVSAFTMGSGKMNFNRLPVDFSMRIQNLGNVHVRPNGSITIRNMLGGTSIVIPVNSVQGAILPASIRKFTASWDKSAGTGSSSFFSEFGNELRNFALGPYTATLALTYGQNNDKALNSTVRFYIFPWHVLLLALVLIVLIIWLIMFSVKRYNKWIIRKASPQPTQKK